MEHQDWKTILLKNIPKNGAPKNIVKKENLPKSSISSSVKLDENDAGCIRNSNAISNSSPQSHIIDFALQHQLSADEVIKIKYVSKDILLLIINMVIKNIRLIIKNA